MSLFLELPNTITIGENAAVSLIHPAAFRADRGDQFPALYLAVGNGVREDKGLSLCDLYKVDLFNKITTKITTSPLPFGLVLALSYDPIADELLLIDGNKTSSNKVFRINYNNGELIDYYYNNYGTSSVIEDVSGFPYPKESGFLAIHSNPSRPLERVNFFNTDETLFERRNLFFFTYYQRGSLLYPPNEQNNFSYLISSQTPGSSNILTFKTIKSNLVISNKKSSFTADLLNDKILYRAIGNKIFFLDRFSLKTKDQIFINETELDILSVALWNNNFFTIHSNSNKIYQTLIVQPGRLTKLSAYSEQNRIKPEASTNLFAQVTDEKYSTLKDITITSKVLIDKEIDKISSSCSSSNGALVLSIQPENISIRDPFEFKGLENLEFKGSQYALTVSNTDPTTEENFSDKMLTFQTIDQKDKTPSAPLLVENIFSAIPIGSIFDTNNKVLSFWSPKDINKPLILEFNSPQTFQMIEIVLTKNNTGPLIIKDSEDNIIYENNDNLGYLNKLTILEFIRTPEITSNKLKIFAPRGTKIFDIKTKISVDENLGFFEDTLQVSSQDGQVQFNFKANKNKGTELVKVAAHNKTIEGQTTTTLLNNELIETALLNIEIDIKEVASSIVLSLKNPQSAFSYATLSYSKPPPPRPTDSVGAIIDYPDIPVLGNDNIIDSGSYITSITTSNNLVWVLSRGGNASIVSTNPTADILNFIITPNQQSLGAKNINITITAQQNFSFNTSTNLNFGPGIIVNSIKVLDTLEEERPRIVANITISDITTLGKRDITINSGNNNVTLSNSFEVLPQSASAISPVNLVAEASETPRFQTLFINSASLNSSVSWGPFIFIVDSNGYLTRAANNLILDKFKLLDANILGIRLFGNKLIIGTEQGAFYEIIDAQDPLSFTPTLSYINSIPKVLTDFVIFQDKIFAINKGIKKIDLIDLNTLQRTTDINEISTSNLRNIWLKDERLFISDNIGGLFEINPLDFSTINVTQIPNDDIITGIEVIKDFIYISSEKGLIYRYDTNNLELYYDVSQEGGIVSMSKYFDTLQVGTEYGRYITLRIG